MRSCRRAASRSDLNGVQERLLPFFSSLGWCVHALGRLLLSLSPPCVSRPPCQSAPLHSAARLIAARLLHLAGFPGRADWPVRRRLPAQPSPAPSSRCLFIPAPAVTGPPPLPPSPAGRSPPLHPSDSPAFLATTPFPRLTLSGPLPPFHCLPLSLSLFQHSPTFHTLSLILHSLPALPSSRISPYLHSISPSFHSSLLPSLWFHLCQLSFPSTPPPRSFTFFFHHSPTFLYFIAYTLSL